ncbi:hypothetical protein EX30DRAFT_339301 [Ascodesmis nigricans]|uniref:Uncharacterized protein n=1 Tax=Ascodesmis nigricans TaxID=341454 RepID=A0A4S2N1Q6_9PEZI|nr:hypothetical protein EX30DRAFT_339301 [Ascodesmis nigricans]
MAPRIRDHPTTLYTRFPSNNRTPPLQILQATWIYLHFILLSIAFILTLAQTTNNRETDSNLWVFSAPWLLSFGGIVLKIGLEAVISVALFQRLWYGMSMRVQTDAEVHRQRMRTQNADMEKGRSMTGLEGKSKLGVSLRELDSRHQASRLSVGMFLTPSWSAVWVLGCVGLMVTVAAVPALQVALETVQRTVVISTHVEAFHAGLDPRLAMPLMDGEVVPMPYTKRGGALALFGERNAYQYTLSNVTGEAELKDVEFVDLDCNVEVIRGTVEAGSDEWYYNFTADWKIQGRTQPLRGTTGNSATTTKLAVSSTISARDTETTTRTPLPTRTLNPSQNSKRSASPADSVDKDIFTFSSVSVTAWLNNNTHFLHHRCILRPAIGTCRTRLTAGTASMSLFRCTRDRFLYADFAPSSSSAHPKETGFLATASTFISFFKGAAWLSDDGYPRENSTFTQAAIRFATLSDITLPKDLISHMQRVLWHIPITSQPVDVPALQRTRVKELISEEGGLKEGGLLNTFLPMNVQAESQRLFLEWDYRVLSSVLLLSVAIVFIVIGWLLMAENRVLGRLMCDSVVHMMTIGGRGGGAIKGAEMAGLRDIINKAGQERVVFGVVAQAWEGVEKEGAGSVGIVDVERGRVGVPVVGRWYGSVDDWEVEESQRWWKRGCGLGIMECNCRGR